MAQQIITQDYPEDIDLYDYAFIDLRRVGSRHNPFRKYLYQLIREDSGESFYDSKLFGSHVSPDRIAEYNNIRNFALNDGWQNDGKVYSPGVHNFCRDIDELKQRKAATQMLYVW